MEALSGKASTSGDFKASTRVSFLHELSCKKDPRVVHFQKSFTRERHTGAVEMREFRDLNDLMIHDVQSYGKTFNLKLSGDEVYYTA